MANERSGKGGGGFDRKRDQTTEANKPPIDLNTIAPEELDRQSEEWGKKLADRWNGVTTNQIRNLYAAVQHIRVRANQSPVDQEDINRRLILLKPKLAYASGRQPVLKPLRNFLVQAIDSVVKNPDSKKARENFFILMESIVAYHKFHGGRNS